MPRAKKPAPGRARLAGRGVLGTTSPGSTRRRRLVEVVEFLRDRGCSRSSARACPAGSCCTARPARAKRSSRRPSRARPARTSTRRARRRSLRCSRASAPCIRKLFEEARKHAGGRRSSTMAAISTTQIGEVHRDDQALNSLSARPGPGRRPRVVVMAASEAGWDSTTTSLDEAAVRRSSSPCRYVGARRSSPCTRATSRSPRTSISARSRARRRGSPGRTRNLCNGPDLRGSLEHLVHPAGRLRRGDGPYRRRAAAAPRGLGEEADLRVPRGRARGDVTPRRRPLPGTEGNDRLAWPNPRSTTLNTSTEDRYMHTREEFLDLMKVFLAGRAAEEVVFGRITNGAAGATSSASPRSPARWCSVPACPRWRRRGRARRQLPRCRRRRSASATRSRLASPIRLRGGEAPPSQAPRAILDRVAGALLEKETLDRSALEALLADVVPESHSSETVGTVRALNGD